MIRRVWDVLNTYEAELVVSSSWWMKEMITVSTEISPAPYKPRPLLGANEAKSHKWSSE